MLPEGELGGGLGYMSCCGKVICSGCCHAHSLQSKWEPTCPFCRSANPTNGKEYLERLNKRMKANDANAYFSLGTS
jgi:hypothetical protein